MNFIESSGTNRNGRPSSDVDAIAWAHRYRRIRGVGVPSMSPVRMIFVQ
jgi:hypothetical protein